MGRSNGVGLKRRNARRKVRPKDQGSDESDEDFIIGEGEEFESDDYCSSLDLDESEEALEHDAEEVAMKVKKEARCKTRRSLSALRGKRSKKKPKKKKNFSNKQDSDDEFIEDEDDVEFIPDEIDDVVSEHETPVIKKRWVSYRDDDDEEDNDDDNYVEFIQDETDYADCEDETPVIKKRTVSYRDDDYDDGDGGGGGAGGDYDSEDQKDNYEDSEKDEDEDFTIDSIDFVDEEDDILLENKCKKVRNFCSRDRGAGKGKKRKRKFEVMINPTTIPKKPRTNRRQVRKIRTGSIPRYARKTSAEADGELPNKSLAVEGRSEKIPVRGKPAASSDSDFMSPASSDSKFTTSRKEREQRRFVGKNRSGIVAIPRLARKSSGTDGEFANKSLLSEDRSKMITVRRRKKRVASSDSESMCPASDYEYTISEEEREQMREADKFCSSLNTNSRNRSSLKNCKEKEDICEQIKQPGRKGKEKLEDLNKVLKQVCGICLSEEDKRTVRGTLNCCIHFFCFACIMEWSKIESRCPLCKQRFVTISRMAISDPGSDLRTVVIQVPERDQVYQPSEEELRGFLDPYDAVVCTECQQGGDDALMLLCDICDSPAHTYCVGLGHEVPEGNWYCEGCRPAASGALNLHGSNPAPDHRLNNNLSGLSSPLHNVAELDLNSLYVPDSPLTQQTGPLPITRHFRSGFYAASPTSGLGPLTLYDRRRTLIQIHQFLNNRRNIQSNDMPSMTSGIRLFGSQIDGGAGLAIQRTVTPETRTSQYTSGHGRLQDYTETSLPNRAAASARSSILREQRQNSEHGGINMVFSSTLAYEQLHLCNSGSNVDYDGPSYTFREGTMPSRTSQGSMYTPF